MQVDKDIKKLSQYYKASLSEEIQSAQNESTFRAFPHSAFPVVIQKEDKPIVKIMNYSLIPTWSKERRPKFTTYNARIETICEKPTWSQQIKTHRCLVGFSSFFESCYEGSHAGNIVEFKNENNSIWTAAGLWSEWSDKKTGEVIESFAIITTTPSPYIKSIGHDRTPFFLKEQALKDWILPVTRNSRDAVNFLLSSYQPLQSSKVIIEKALKPGWQKHSKSQAST